MSVQMSAFTTRKAPGPSSGSALENAAAGLERHRALLAPADRTPNSRAVAERGAQLRAQPGEIDDHFAYAGARQRGEVPGDERAAADLHQRLGQRVGERPHALAAAGGEQHRLHARAAALPRRGDARVGARQRRHHALLEEAAEARPARA